MIENHPECPRRLRAVEDQLSAKGLMDILRYYEAPNAKVAQLERAHGKEYKVGEHQKLVGWRQMFAEKRSLGYQSWQ